MSEITRRGFVKGAALAPLALTPLGSAAPQAAKADRFDIVAAGAGHNSLITAAYLAKAGFRCVVLEGRPTVGGDVKSAQLTLRGCAHRLPNVPFVAGGIGCASPKEADGFLARRIR